MTVGLGWRGCCRIARRDLHPGVRGLRLLFVCLFLAVATLATIGNLTAAIPGEIASTGRLLLGGDRPEERRVGAAFVRTCSSRGAPFHSKNRTESEKMRIRQ